MRTLIVLTSSEDDLLAFVMKFAESLHTQRDIVLVLSTAPFDFRWQIAYQSRGISLTLISPAPEVVPVWPPTPIMRLSETVAGFIQGADVVYFQDWTAFHTVRTLRFQRSQMPVCISFWYHVPPFLTHKQFPSVVGDLNAAFIVDYAARHSDFVIAMSTEAQNFLEHANLAPRFLPTEALAGWSAFHAEVREYKKAARRSMSPPDTPVDVCIPYFNHGRYLPQMLMTLERQTYKNFGVIVVDDASTDLESRQVFAELARKYPAWRFEAHKENRGGGAVRMTLAQLSRAEYIVFLDSDDVLAPTMIERLLQAVQWSGDDCIVAPAYSFKGDGWPIDPTSGEIMIPAEFLYMPVGNSLTASLIDDMHGGAAIIIRRTVYLESGVAQELKGVGYEDYEMHVRLGLARYKTDVLPDYVYYYRLLETSMARTTNFYLNSLRVLTAYEEWLEPLGLGKMALAFKSLFLDVERLRKRREMLSGNKKALS